jgi:opacity protein-like surface antigen
MRFTKIAAAGAALAMAAGMAMAVPASANQIGEGQGCTPGFWKNHLDWKSYDDNSNPTNDDFLPGSDVETALRIDVPAAYSTSTVNFETMTSLQALNARGGAGLNGATQILLRAAVASYLNADAALNFPLRRFDTGLNGEASMKSEIQRVLDSGSRSQIISYATFLDGLNNAGCPLS